MMKTTLKYSVLLFFLCIGTPFLAQEKLIPFLKGNKWGYSDVNGKLIVPATYDSTFFYSLRNLKGYVVNLNKKEGLIDLSGKLICPAKYDKIEENKSGFFTLKSGNKTIITKTPFEAKQRYEYDRTVDLWLEHFDLFSYLITTRNGKTGFLILNIKESSFYEIPPIYDSIKGLIDQNGVFVVTACKGGVSKQLSIPKIHTVNEPFSFSSQVEEQMGFAFEEGLEETPISTLNKMKNLVFRDSCELHCIVKNKKEDGNKLVQLHRSPWYDRLDQLKNCENRFIVQKYGKYGLYDCELNKELIGLSYDSLIYERNSIFKQHSDFTLRNIEIYRAKHGDTCFYLGVDLKGRIKKLLSFEGEKKIDAVYSPTYFIICVQQESSCLIYNSYSDQQYELKTCPQKIMYFGSFINGELVFLVLDQGKKFYMNLNTGTRYYSPE